MTKLHTEELDGFSEQLFRTLDHLGSNPSGKDLLPFSLVERPSAFEKYPRMLIALVQRHGVEAGFQEWCTKVLRDANDYRKRDEFPALERLHTWMVEHKELLQDKSHLAHLKRSLYGRAYAYLYPRRLLTTTYAEANRGNAEALEEKSILANFRQAVAGQIDQLHDIYSEGETLAQIVADAEQYLVANRKRLTWKKRSQEAE